MSTRKVRNCSSSSSKETLEPTAEPAPWPLPPVDAENPDKPVEEPLQVIPTPTTLGAPAEVAAPADDDHTPPTLTRSRKVRPVATKASRNDRNSYGLNVDANSCSALWCPEPWACNIASTLSEAIRAGQSSPRL